MQDVTASGEWILVWLSPVAQFLFDLVFAVLLLAAASAVIKLVQRARHKDTRTPS
jgi:hypothetical protein